MTKSVLNWPLLPVKLHYFIFSTALAFVLPFRTVFAKQLGISATAAGFIFLAVPFLKVVTNPLIGYLIDTLKKFRLILAIFLVIVGLTNLSMVLLPPLRTNQDTLKNFSFGLDYQCPGSGQSYNNIFNPCNGSYQQDLHLACKLSCSASGDILNEEFLGYQKDCHGRDISVESQVEFKIEGCSYTLELDNRTVYMYMSYKNYKYKAEYQLLESTYIRIKYEDISMNSSSTKLNSTAVDLEYSFLSQLPVSDTADLLCACKKDMSCVVSECRYHEKSIQQAEPEVSEYLSYQFWSLFLLIGVSSVCMCAVMFLVDAVCYEMLKQDRDRFGYQRLWGTVGWGVGVLAGGYVNTATSDDQTDYSMSFYIQALIVAVNLIPVWKLKVHEVPFSPRILKDVGRLLSNLDVFLNLLIVLCIGVLSGVIWNYQFWFMEEIGSSQLIMGLSQMVECIFAEVPCFLVSGWIIRKIGYSHCYDLTFLCFGLRYLCYAYMTDPWMTLPVGLLHGPTFGIFYAAMTMYGKTNAPPGTEATVQALLAMVFEGIGVGIGCVAGGIGFDRLGSRVTFLCAAGISFISLVLRMLPQLLKTLMARQEATSSPATVIAKQRDIPNEINRLSLMLKV